jgi:hypothetical protein
MFTLMETDENRRHNFAKQVTSGSGWQACRLFLLVYCLVYSSLLKVEVIRSSKTSGFLRTAWLYNPEDRTLHRQDNDSEDTEIPLVGAPDSNAFTRATVYMGFVYLRDSQSLPALRGTCLMAHFVGGQLFKDIVTAYRFPFEL